MKIALVAAGQPRFTEAFPIFMNQLKGVDQADLYFHFFENDWCMDPVEARRRIEPVLSPPYNLKKIEIKPRGPWQLPPHTKEHTSHEKQSVNWYYYRATCQWYSLWLSSQLIEEQYDAVIRFRLDCRLDRDIDVSKLDLSRGPIMPHNNQCGTEGRKVCDQFAIGTQEDMKFYFDFWAHYDEYIPEVCSYWEDMIHHWSPEHLLGWHYHKNNRQIHQGDFNILLKPEGRSAYDDHNWHIQPGQDPTVR